MKRPLRHNIKKLTLVLSLLFMTALLFVACNKTTGGSNGNLPDRSTVPIVLTPEASGEDTIGNSSVTIDYSNAQDGYVMVNYTGGNPKVKLLMASENNTELTYDYYLSQDEWEAFPLSESSGKYTFEVYESVQPDTGDNTYTLLFSDSVTIESVDEFGPFLYPNQFVDFTAQSQAVIDGQDIAAGSKTELDVVKKVYEYVVTNFTYDYDKAGSVQPGYLPVVDTIWKERKGICFDYAAVMAAVLRTQNIPTRLVVGWVYTSEEDVYHAWVRVYTDEHGWVDAVEFIGDNWVLMDPTFASTSGAATRYEINADNYYEMYYY